MRIDDSELRTEGVTAARGRQGALKWNAQTETTAERPPLRRLEDIAGEPLEDSGFEDEELDWEPSEQEPQSD